MASEEGWVGITDVATHLSVAKDSIYRWIDTKDFPAHRVGRLLRFRLSEVDEWVIAALVTRYLEDADFQEIVATGLAEAIYVAVTQEQPALPMDA